MNAAALVLYDISTHVENGRFDTAFSLLENTGKLSSHLEGELTVMKHKHDEIMTEKWVLRILEKMDLKNYQLSDPELIIRIESKKLSRKTQSNVKKYIKLINSKYAETDFYKQNKALLDGISQKVNSTENITLEDTEVNKLIKTLNLSQSDSTKLIKEINNLTRKLKDPTIADKPKLARDMMDQCSTFIPRSQERILGEFIRSFMEKNGVNLPPPAGPPPR